MSHTQDKLMFAILDSLLRRLEDEFTGMLDNIVVLDQSPESFELEFPGFIFTCDENLEAELSNLKHYELKYSLPEQLDLAIADICNLYSFTVKRIQRFLSENI